ncbi:hypothetical protein [Murimonas intestini]|uniref:Uncharacterized protein n=1 Tax=Murimonas intestini TaxID=1337051 RepID=A0AB73T1F3_9FIRM|nr:hypothetical protein [Murimonas intestini]MCR1842516.1 hypothetical protein [Murimonas intestini]MCR1867126.1 hypothetical protein [Murimonas intestini]MCR1884312.1 hypothetical protein [Murimonas intestini]
MENSQNITVIPHLDTKSLTAQLQNYTGKLKLDIDSSELQRQLQTALKIPVKVPIELKTPAPPSNEKNGFLSFLSEASSYSTKTVIPSVG